MRKFNRQNEEVKNVMKVAKRIAITILCCLPFLGVFGYLTRNIITSDFLQVVCFVIIMGATVAIEEIIVRNKEKKEQDDDSQDVFK